MIKSISIEGFKSLRKVDIKLGNLNLFIGTNASGKSNFFDALRVLQGIGYGFSFDEILNGKPRGSGNTEWKGIRGGSDSAFFEKRGIESTKDDFFKIAVQLRTANAFDLKFSIGISSRLTISEEYFANGDLPIVEHTHDVLSQNTAPFSFFIYILNRMNKTPVGEKTETEAVENFIRELRNFQQFNPSIATLREYSETKIVRRMGEQGENFAALVNQIISDPKTKEAYVSWLKELTPSELDDVKILSTDDGEYRFALKDGDATHSAKILSEGTLKFAAITAALFQPDMPSVLMLEEIENGIHPTRLRLLVEMLKNRSKHVQIIATTHSPMVLSWLDEKDYEYVFLFKRDEETGATQVKPLTEVPHLLDIIKKKHSIGELFSEGWLEGAL